MEQLPPNTISSFILGALAGASLTYGFIKITNASQNTLQSTSNIGYSPSTYQESSSALSDLLKNTSIEYLLTPTKKPVTVIEYRSSVDEYRSSVDYALMLMADLNIVAIPVICLEKRRYVGMLNVLDIISFLASRFNSPDKTLEDKREEELAAELRSVSVAEVMKYNREPFLPLYLTSPLTLLVHIMSSLADEVPIMGSEYQIVNIANRVDVLRFIADNIDVLGARADALVSSLLPRREPGTLATIDIDTRVVDALALMDKTGVQELAIVNAFGKLEGNLCAADFRRLSTYNLARLYEPVSKFVSLGQDSAVCVEPECTLRFIINKFVDTRTTVVWMVDNFSSTRPVDSISIRSIMQMLLDFASAQNS